MDAISAFLNWGIGSFTYQVPWYSTTSKVRAFNISSDLINLLSPGASIVSPSSSRFVETESWNLLRPPNFQIIVEVATESDVQQTVKYANQHGIQFLARSGGHGTLPLKSSFNNGINIWMRKLNTIDISPDGQTATIGGGALSKEVTDALWARGKQTVTGYCECVGAVAPLLGGGYGILQGYYGLLADNLVSARMILANGTAVNVSADSHADLFWAIRGAGHNFGVITEYRYKVYDVPPDDMWQVYTFTYEGSNVEPVFEELNRFAKTTAHLPGIFYFSNFIRLPQIDTARAVILVHIFCHGDPSVATRYTQPFEDIGPLDVKKHQSVTYPEIPSLTATGVDDFACLHGSSVILSPINIQEFNLEAQRAVFEVFTKVTGEVPELSNAFIMFEGYSLDGVKAVPEDSTAFAHRGDNIVISPAMMYSPNTSVDAIAIEATNKMRSILHEGAGGGELHTYVNYAFGNETLENMYGYGKWRLERLRGLKRAYDPFGRFNYYAPIS